MATRLRFIVHRIVIETIISHYFPQDLQEIGTPMYGTGNWGRYYRQWPIQLVRQSVPSMHATKSHPFGAELWKAMCGDQHLFPGPFEGCSREMPVDREIQALTRCLMCGKHRHPPLCRNLVRGSWATPTELWSGAAKQMGRIRLLRPHTRLCLQWTHKFLLNKARRKEEPRSWAKLAGPSWTRLSQDETSRLAAWLSRHLTALEQGFLDPTHSRSLVPFTWLQVDRTIEQERKQTFTDNKS